MNATYLGLFKKHAGKPFKEYLNDKRIEEAKRAETERNEGFRDCAPCRVPERGLFYP